MLCHVSVPCLKRAKELESYDPNSEYTLDGEGGEEGWVATHRDPQVPGPTGTEDIPCIDAEGPAAAGSGTKEGQGLEEDDIPDMAELELQAEQDEVGWGLVGCCSSLLRKSSGCWLLAGVVGTWGMGDEVHANRTSKLEM